MAKRVDFQAMKDGNWIQDSLKREKGSGISYF